MQSLSCLWQSVKKSTADLISVSHFLNIITFFALRLLLGFLTRNTVARLSPLPSYFSNPFKIKVLLGSKMANKWGKQDKQQLLE